MTERTQSGLSARQLILFFFAGVAVCAVFFALGFLVGYNERAPTVAADTERVTPPSDIPPTVNPPMGNAKTAAKSASTGSSAKAEEPLSEEVISSPPGRGQSNGAAESKAGRQGGLAVQVVASTSRQDAATLVGVLKGRGYSAFLLTPGEVRSGDKLFRVEVGPFSSRAEAEKVRRKLADEGFKPFLRY
jgi:cell division septation protein DedD